MRELVRVVQRWGIARRHEDVSDDDTDVEQPFVVVIRPAIADVLGETPLQRLALFASQRAALPSAAGAADVLDGDVEDKKREDVAVPPEVKA